MCQANSDGVLRPESNSFNQSLTTKNFMRSKRFESTELDRRTWLLANGDLSSTNTDWPFGG